MTAAAPNGFTWRKLGELCERIDYGFTASADFSLSEPRFLRITDIQNGTVHWDKVPGCKISKEETAANQLCDGDIVFARTGATTGKSFLIRNPPPSVFASYLIRLRLRPGIRPDFLFLFFNSELYWEQIRSQARGGAQPNFNASMLAELRVLCTEEKKQEVVIEYLREQLAAVERARAAVEAQLQAAEALPAAFLRAVFNTEAAKKWPIMPLIEASEISGGVTLGRNLRGQSVRSVPYLRVANVKDGRLDLAEIKNVDATESEIADCRLIFGDILLTEGGDPDKLGRGSYWQEQIPECIHQNHIFRVRFDLSRFNPAFIAFQMASPYGKAYFLAHAKQTTGIASINKTVLSKFPLLVPAFEKQRAIATQLEAERNEAERLRTHLTKKLADLEKFPQTLLREVFNGSI